jgi:S1-C subfamily serine protease
MREAFMPNSQIAWPLRLAMIAVLVLAGLTESRANNRVGPRFGITVSSLSADTAGVMVSDVKVGSVGEAGGIRIGDIIQEVSGEPIANIAEYENAMRKVDTMVMFLINRKGEHSYVALEGPPEPVR